MKHDFIFSPRVEDTGLAPTRWQRKKLVKDLPSPLYWVKPTRRILWNVELIRHLYLVCDGDRSHQDHQRLIEKYQATLPQSA